MVLRLRERYPLAPAPSFPSPVPTPSRARAASYQVGGSSNPFESPPSTATPDPTILFVGMNATSSHEVESLRGQVGKDGIFYVKNSSIEGHFVHQGTLFDLTTREGKEAFAAHLGLEGERAEALIAAFGEDDWGGTKGAADEIAQLAVVLNEAELGERQIERVVLSGHSTGGGVWGDYNGVLGYNAIAKLREAFPGALAQVEDVMIAGCYSGGERGMDQLRGLFPNAKTIMAYYASAPGSWSGAVPHLLRWERATRGDDTSSLDRSLFAGTRKGENVAVWTVTEGYDSGLEPRPIEEHRSFYEVSSEVVPEFFAGRLVVEDTQSGILRTHYNNIQHLLSRPDLPEEERGELEREREQIIRLIYFENVSRHFQAEHGEEIAVAFRDLGLNPVDFSSLGRAEAMAVIEDFDARFEALQWVSPEMERARQLLHEGLRDLSPLLIPSHWI